MPNLNSKIALVITDRETNAQIKGAGAGLLELRADLFKDLDPAYVLNQIHLRKKLKIPLLLTLRNQKKEGALKECPDALKMRVLNLALPLVDMVDIELSSPLLKEVIKMAHSRTLLPKARQRVKVIVSSHYLQDTPRDLESILKKSLSTRADIVKIAAKANTFGDVMTMINFTYHHRKHPLITMSLGAQGSLSRLVLPGAGSLYTYTFLNKPTAQGQVDIKTLRAQMELYYSHKSTPPAPSL